MAIYEQERFLNLRLEVLVLGKNSAENIDAWKVLERLVLLCKLSGVVHTGGESPQDGLRDVWTCGITLALAYMLHHLFVT